MLKKPSLDMIGKKIGMLSIVDAVHIFSKKANRNIRFAVCICDCGNKKSIRMDGVISGVVTSCGCNKITKLKEASTKHGDSTSNLYGNWRCMIARCSNPNDASYHKYGGRGIKVCPEWMSYPVFKKWAIENGYRVGLTLDRMNNDSGYEPGNCWYTTPFHQARNTRRNINIKIGNETKCLEDWAISSGVNKNTLYARIVRYGMKPEIAIQKKYFFTGKKIKVKCVETGVIYDSMELASKDTGIPSLSISRIVRCETKNPRCNLHFVKC